MVEKIREILEENGQAHLLQYYDELETEKKEFLLEQIKAVDFEIIRQDKSRKKGKIEPIEALKLQEIQKKKELFETKGLEALKKGKVGAVLLAGGQGTRLGFDKPKGTLNVGEKKELYLFEILINNIREVCAASGSFMYLFIMASDINYQDTVEFLANHEYFGYNKKYVRVFKQEMAPSVDYNGKIYMEEKWKLSMSPNGNGGWFSSMAKSGLMELIHEEEIEWLNVFSVDNVLQKIADLYLWVLF
jgi:UDP-N-acetylglucosamine/UDP-N-acetylgalactosamine diphosphorylase